MTAEQTAVAVTPTQLAVMRGDVSDLAPADRVALVRSLVDDAALRWGAAPPVILVKADGRLVPYLTKAGADQLAALRGASILELVVDDRDDARVVDVTARARAADGRTNVDVGSCEYDPTAPASRARARMVAATRARRRVILGLLGSGFAWSQQAEQALGYEDPES